MPHGVGTQEHLYPEDEDQAGQKGATEVDRQSRRDLVRPEFRVRERRAV